MSFSYILKQLKIIFRFQDLSRNEFLIDPSRLDLSDPLSIKKLKEWKTELTNEWYKELKIQQAYQKMEGVSNIGVVVLELAWKAVKFVLIFVRHTRNTAIGVR